MIMVTYIGRKMAETEEIDGKTPPFDAEWEIIKNRRRIDDILNEFDELKQKHRQLSARITRLHGIVKQEFADEEEEEHEPPEAFPQPFDPSQFRAHVLQQYHRLKNP